ncbi:MAG: NAD(P)-binding protein [Ruminococcus sp.]|nr:NAD(P)-binding protein [Ruminococcus sp.]
MLRLSQIRLRPGHSEQELEDRLRKLLNLKKSEPLEYQIFKQSIDARKKPDIFYTYTVDVKLRQEEAVLKRAGQKKQRPGQIEKQEEVLYQPPAHGAKKLSHRPVVAGAGPAGLFCAWLLAREGYRPLLLERGAPVEERIRDVEAFWKGGPLDPESNVQFGEGGAGTFSDGKLNTLVKDACGRNRLVLEAFVRFGAPEQILYEQKPHIGTDILSRVIRNLREEIRQSGGEIRFHSRLTGLTCAENAEGRSLRQITVNDMEEIPAEVLVIAVGHSARDTFRMLLDSGIPMQAKAFAVGVRVEHPQQMIQKVQYGSCWAGKLPAASYKLSENLDNGRGVYTFCMCPGGYVVNASSEAGRIAVNGMSYHGRAGINANSAVIVTVSPKDFGNDHPLAGVEFQRRLEATAYREGQGRIPVQRFGDFCRNVRTTALGMILPQIKGEYRLANVRGIFPEELADSLQRGICAMDKRIPGFAREDMVLSGVESRTSSPVRMIRGDTMECEIGGIYPCGEGAGYAGGIMSAAMDGVKVGEAIIGRFRGL